MTPRKDIVRDERGAAMIYVAIFMLSCLWFVSLAIDMGKMTVTKGELQRAADAAALAGASAVDAVTGNLDQTLARSRATYFGGENTALQETSAPVVIDPNDIVFPDAHTIQVTARREGGNAMTTIFARTLGLGSVGLHAVATAKSIPVEEPCQRLAPMAPVQIPGGYKTDCASIYTLKVGSGGNNPGAGEFQLLDFGTTCDEPPCDNLKGGGIGPLLECWMAQGYGCCVKIGDEWFDTGVTTKPGNNVGKVKSGLTTRWKSDTDQTENICYSQYTGNGQRVVACPIVDTWDVNGKTNVKVVAFAAFFLRDKPTGGGTNNVVHAQFINYIAPGNGTENPPVGPTLYTIRLIQNATN